MLELNKIYNEPNLVTMSKMPDCFIDLVVTSPPYDELRTYTGEAEWNFEVFKPIARELYRVIKQGGVIVWIVNDSTTNGSESGTSFKQALYFKEIGFNLHDTMIYGKENPIPLTHNRYEQEFEYMFIFSKGKPKCFNPILIKTSNPNAVVNRARDSRNYDSDAVRFRPEKTETKEYKQKGNIWKYSVGKSYGDASKHPAIFPEQLATDHIKSWSNENDIVYDPFMGSGTTGVCAIKLNRQYIGSEISKVYTEIAVKRAEDEKAQMTIFEL